MSGFEPTEEQTGVGSNFLTLIDPDAIPYPETDAWSLNYAAETLRTGGGELGSITEAMESTWQGLQEHYDAPESETLFAAVSPVATIGAGLEGDLATVATALEDLAEAAAEARRELNSLRIQAQGFVRGLEDREFWWLTKDEENDEWSLETNFALKSNVNSAWSAFTAAEIACANTINGVYGGATFTSPDDATGDANELVYGESRLMFEPGEDARSAAHAVTAWSLDNVTEWAGQHFNPESVQFDNPRGQAAWDTLALGAVWGPLQGAVIKAGYWNEKNGWASNNDEYVDNLKTAWTDTALEAGELFGVRNEDGWLYDPRSDNPSENLSWEWWWDNAKNSGEEIREGHAAWSKRDSDPEYQQTYTAINTITLVGGPIKLGLDVLNLGNGRSGGGTGIDSGSESGPFGGQGTGPGTGGSDREIADIVADGRIPIAERFGDVLEQTPALPQVTPDRPGVSPSSGPSGPPPNPTPPASSPSPSGPNGLPSSGTSNPPGSSPNTQVPPQGATNPGTSTPNTTDSSPVTTAPGTRPDAVPPGTGRTSEPGGDPAPPIGGAGPNQDQPNGQAPPVRVEDNHERPVQAKDDDSSGGAPRGNSEDKSDEPIRSDEISDPPEAKPGGGNEGGGEPPEPENRTGDADDGDSYRSPQPGTPEYERRVQELVDDPASGPANTQHKEDAARREAEVGLAAEQQGLLKGPIRRGEMDYTDPSNVKDGGDFIDATGQPWDVKGFRDTFPPSAGPMAGKPLKGRGAFNISKVEKAILNELGDGENVLLDLGVLTDLNNRRSIEDLVRGNPDWDGRVVLVYV